MNSVQFAINGKQSIWLIDTGASLSAIKRDVALSTRENISPKVTYIDGIGGKITSYGTIRLNLETDTQSFNHKFHVLTNLPLKVDGIIGQDFLIKYKCVINFEKEIITLNHNNKFFNIPLNLKIKTQNSIHSSQIKLPARCESIIKLSNNYKGDCVVMSSEIGEGIFVANTITRCVNGKISVKILNTRDEDVILNSFTPQIRPLNNYVCYSFEQCQNNADRVKLLFSFLKLNNLNTEEKNTIANICAKFADIFHLPGDSLNTTNLYEQKIRLKPNTSPVYSKPYRLPQSQKSEINKQIKQMLENDIIEESQSEWASPLLLVPKKADSSGEKKWRLVIDYRKVNEVIENDKFPLPNITDILDSLSGAMYYSTLDMNQSYYQVTLDPESRKYTAFIADKHYQMKRLPMGLKTSPNAFSRAMTIAMSGLNYLQCIIYLDDIIIMGRNLHQHNKNLIDIFTRLRKVNFKLNPLKCNFLQKEILYLGHVVTPDGIKPDPKKISVVQNYPVPKNTDEVRRFVAFVNYYRKFIPHFSEITQPLNNLLKKNIEFHWDNNCIRAFERLKIAISSPPLLQYPDFSSNNEFVLHTDASGVAIGCVLSNKNCLPVAYASRPLNKAEKNYPTIEKELLAIVWAIKYFRPYLYGRSFRIITDHRPLIYLFNMSNPSSRLTKFRLCLEEYDFTVEYLKGKENAAADALSRIEISSTELKSMTNNVMSVMTRAQKKRMEEQKQVNDSGSTGSSYDWTDQPNIVGVPKKLNNLPELSFNNKDYDKILKQTDCISSQNNIIVYSPSLQTMCIAPDSRSRTKRAFLARELDAFCTTQNIKEVCILQNNDTACVIIELAQYINNKCGTWSGPRLCIIKGVTKINSKDDRRVILNDFHLLPTSGHAGIRRMTNNMKRYYYWQGMDNDIIKFVKNCDKCQKQKFHRNIKQPMCITSTATTAFDKIFLDLVGPLTKDANGYCYILTLQCELTKYVEAYPLLNKETETVARAFIDNFILRYGIPNEIATDRGTEFISSTMQEVCKILNINQLQSTAYHHESLGSLENSHKSLGAFLRIQTDNQAYKWSDWLQYWCFSYNTTIHSSTTYTPYELVFGKLCRIPSNIINRIDPVYNFNSYNVELKYRLQKSQEDARNNLIKSKINRKLRYDLTTNSINYRIGDLILLKKENRDKMDPVYSGPYTVMEDQGMNVKILVLGKEKTVHKNRTQKYNYS